MSLWTDIRDGAKKTVAEIGKGIESVWNDYTGKTAVDKQNEANKKEAQKNRDWQEYMSNTAYQRQVADLMAAGINPNAAGTLGGASTPGGAQAEMNAEPSNAAGALQLGETVASMAQGASGIANAVKTMSENRFIPSEKKAQIANTAADTVLKGAQTGSTNASTQQIKANTEVAKETAKQLKIDNISRDEMNKTEIMLKKTQNREVQERIIAEMLKNAYNKKYGTTPDMAPIERIAQSIVGRLERIPGSLSDAIKQSIKEMQNQ
ncbi:DNA pilot protein [Dipodfec virus UOA04_Rod_615]|nr:DNA pilot protein [Dipodfec virus UOA04_Rod_615]